jgi:hypothetical protein
MHRIAEDPLLASDLCEASLMAIWNAAKRRVRKLRFAVYSRRLTDHHVRQMRRGVGFAGLGRMTVSFALLSSPRLVGRVGAGCILPVVVQRNLVGLRPFRVIGGRGLRLRVDRLGRPGLASGLRCWRGRTCTIVPAKLTALRNARRNSPPRKEVGSGTMISEMTPETKKIVVSGSKRAFSPCGVLEWDSVKVGAIC